jgi:hypothetical protein
VHLLLHLEVSSLDRSLVWSAIHQLSKDEVRSEGGFQMIVYG